MQQRELFLDNLRRFLNEEVAPHYECVFGMSSVNLASECSL